MRGKMGLAGLAILALTITATVGGASADPVAHSAGLKKCLKKAKRIEDPVKRKKAKKRCRKKFPTTSTTPASPTNPLIRATLSWSNADNPNATDLDLFVFDTSGNKAGNGQDSIPNSTISTDVKGGSGTETFADTQSPLRSFSFGVCYKTGGSAHVNFTIKYVTADGVTHTDSQFPGDTTHFDYFGGATIPSNYCPS
jgi:hypothetical protein